MTDCVYLWITHTIFLFFYRPRHSDFNLYLFLFSFCVCSWTRCKNHCCVEFLSPLNYIVIVFCFVLLLQYFSFKLACMCVRSLSVMQRLYRATNGMCVFAFKVHTMARASPNMAVSEIEEEKEVFFSNANSLLFIYLQTHACVWSVHWIEVNDEKLHSILIQLHAESSQLCACVWRFSHENEIIIVRHAL